MTIYKYEDMKTVQTCTEASETQGTVQKNHFLIFETFPPFCHLVSTFGLPPVFPSCMP